MEFDLARYFERSYPFHETTPSRRCDKNWHRGLVVPLYSHSCVIVAIGVCMCENDLQRFQFCQFDL